MFNFLNPIILLAAGAAILLPLLIHIFNRQKVRTITFSSLLFLRSLEKTRMRRVKIMEYLLLIIRTLIILLVVAAFARPAIRGGFATKVGAHAKTSVVLLLDNSYSMGYDTKDGPIFEVATKRAVKIIEQLKEGDEASLVLFASEPRMVNSQPTYDFRGLLGYLDQEASLSAEKTDVGRALELAYEILASSKNLNQEIYLITDMDRSGWTAVSPGFVSETGDEANLYLVDVSPAAKQNVFIEKIDFGNQLIERGRPFQITARIANYGSQPARSLLVGLYLDGKRVSQTDVDIERDGKAAVRFAPTVQQAGIHSGFLELTDDDLMVDNRRFFAFRIPERINVLLIGEHPGDTHHLNLSLNPLERSDVNKVVDRATRASLSGVDFTRYRVIILSNVSRLTDVQLSNLERFVQRGGGVLLIPGDDIDTEFYSDQIVRKLLGLNISAPFTATESVTGFFSFEKIDFEHPVFQVYRDVDKDKVPLIKFSSIFELPEGGHLKTLIRFNLGKPALVERSLGKGKIMLMAAPVDQARGDLVMHPFFVPMINRCVEYLASDLATLDEDFLVGSIVTRELPAVLAGKEIELVDPQMKKTALQPSFQTDKLALSIDQTRLPGTYTVRASASASARPEVVDQFAVNIDPKDSDPAKIDVSDVEKKLEGLSFVYIDPEDDIETSILQSRYGRELWKTFLWIAFGLLALEMFLARTRRKEVVEEGQ